MKIMTGTLQLSIRVNGANHTIDIPEDIPLFYVLRNHLGLRGPKFGCGLGQCGACTVHIGNRAIRSCVFPATAVGDEPVTTLEGLAAAGDLHPLQQSFIAEQAAQCGYCINGMIMTAAALLQENPSPTSQEVKDALVRNLCRCGTHLRIVAAILRAAEIEA